MSKQASNTGEQPSKRAAAAAETPQGVVAGGATSATADVSDEPAILIDGPFEGPPVELDGDDALRAEQDALHVAEVAVLSAVQALPAREDQPLTEWFDTHVDALDRIRHETDADYATLAHFLANTCNLVDGHGNALKPVRIKQLLSDARRGRAAAIAEAETAAARAERQSTIVRLVVSRDLEPALRLIAPDLSQSAAASIAIERTAALVAKERAAAPSDEVVTLLGALVDETNNTQKGLTTLDASITALIGELNKAPEGPSPLEAKLDHMLEVLSRSIGGLAARLEKLEVKNRALSNQIDEFGAQILGLTNAVNEVREE